MSSQEPIVFALDASRELGEKIAASLHLSLAAHEEREFEDGEHKSRPLTNVRGCDVYVIQSLYGDGRQSVNDKLCRLLFFIGALRDSSAGRITAVVPYLCYARKDRKTKARDPVTTRYVAQLFEAVGTGRVVTLDVHNLAAYQNAFRCPTDHLEAKNLFVRHFAQWVGTEDVLVLSPDAGGVKRAEEFRRALAECVRRPVAGGFMEKRRSGGLVSGESLFADVRGRTVIILDDLIATGTTILRAAKAAREAGALRVHAAASHAALVGDAARILADPAIDSIVFTDTVTPIPLPADVVARKVVILDAAAMFAEAIRRIHEGGSIAELIGTEP